MPWYRKFPMWRTLISCSSLLGEYHSCLQLVQKVLIREVSPRTEPVHPSSTWINFSEQWNMTWREKSCFVYCWSDGKISHISVHLLNLSVGPSATTKEESQLCIKTFTLRSLPVPSDSTLMSTGTADSSFCPNRANIKGATSLGM